MNPDANFNLPPPTSETPQAISEQELPALPTPEQPAARPESASTPPATNPFAFSSASRASTPPPAAPADDTTSPAPPSTTATPTDAADTTNIEKEWVLKAKQIVQQTADSPFEQNRQLAYVKADYLQKRYGKVVKLAE